MTTKADGHDEAAIDALVADFYAAFDNRGGRRSAADRLIDILLPEAVIVRVGQTGIETMTVETFIAPRARMLADGTLTDFHEWETGASTQMLRGIASRRSTYVKRGWRNGAPYVGSGTKFIQLVRKHQGWRIAAITWEDD